MNSLIALKGGMQNVISVSNSIRHCRKDFLKIQQQVHFSILNKEDNKQKQKGEEKQKEKEKETSANTAFIHLYNTLVETKKIERDPFQYKLILILQAFENNLHNYYHHVEKRLQKRESPRKGFFSSFFKREKTISKGNIGEMEEAENEEGIENCQNDDSFFIYDDNGSGDYEKSQLGYNKVQDESYYTDNCMDISIGNSTDSKGGNQLVDTERIKYVRGLYVYGSVGRGKTYFLNLLFDRIKLRKLKIHYHNFMQQVHKNFHEEKIKNSENPIKSISIKMSQKYKLIFIDEFQVVHISDAMVIKSLFHHLFFQGTVLLCSSNRNPIHLYHNGLNRERFSPFIKLLFKFNYIHEINNFHDFRLRNSSTDKHVYNIPSKCFEDVKKICIDMFCNTYCKDINYVKKIEKYNEKIKVSDLKMCNIPYSLNRYCIFSFEELCGQNISIDEFNAISNENHTIFIYDITKMNEDIKGNEMRRFILLIDILYEKNTRVFFFSDIPIFQLFQTSSIISHFQFFIEKIKKKYSSFTDFKLACSELLKCGTFNRDIFTSMLFPLGVNTEICNKLFEAINYNVNKEYIPIEYLRNVLSFHMINYEIDAKSHLEYLEDKAEKLEPIPYMLFDESDIDTSQENAFASMRTLSRMKHMSTLSYLEKHKKAYEHCRT
ncbi:nucleotide binding protein, putative [Plasmodium ovale]|uniref:Nucleotide binding protein, putative n=1 Tax=Plasmodium ovale TaxID=36330 RepID=A0A1C3KTH6_PLAOA|nr:nucleotide binding protein, putative [Plasmodium ovale]